MYSLSRQTEHLGLQWMPNKLTSSWAMAGKNWAGQVNIFKEITIGKE